MAPVSSDRPNYAYSSSIRELTRFIGKISEAEGIRLCDSRASFLILRKCLSFTNHTWSALAAFTRH